MMERNSSGVMALCSAGDLEEADARYLRRLCESEGYGTIREVVLSMWAESAADDGYWRPGYEAQIVRGELAEVEAHPPAEPVSASVDEEAA